MNHSARWAFSPLDYAAHLLLCDGDQPPSEFQARCGELLPTVAAKSIIRPGASVLSVS